LTATVAAESSNAAPNAPANHTIFMVASLVPVIRIFPLLAQERQHKTVADYSVLGKNWRGRVSPNLESAAGETLTITWLPPGTENDEPDPKLIEG
jgi:hypothetical protein